MRADKEVETQVITTGITLSMTEEEAILLFRFLAGSNISTIRQVQRFAEFEERHVNDMMYEMYEALEKVVSLENIYQGGWA